MGTGSRLDLAAGVVHELCHAPHMLDLQTAAEILAHWRRLEDERLRRSKERLRELERLRE